MLEPENDNHSTINRIYGDPKYAEGLLITAYTKVPNNSLGYNETATDNAVTNVNLDNYRRMATGEWSALFNPMNMWDVCNSGILYANDFLKIMDTITWVSSSSEVNALYAKRLAGEAYALRGLFELHLLNSIGGKDAAGNLLGIPLYDKFLNANDGFNIPRATFTESMNRIYADFDNALSYLTMDDYKDIAATTQLPKGYETVTVSNYNTVFGSRFNQRISGRTVRALKARAALLAASQVFNSANDGSLWQAAANLAGTVLDSNGGLSGLDPNGGKFYDATRADAIDVTSATKGDQKEIIWRTVKALSSTRETANFPPSLFGKGNINPTQNLVDAFPMANGYPINHPSSTYNATNPYANRDPRLALYICYNGNKVGSTVIKTGVGGGVNAKDSINNSTRTGYYLKKLLREDVNLNPVSATTKYHYEVYIRYTELFLIYAEAANEAWGPDGKGSFVYSARDVIAALRKRAGISQPDAYLATVTTKDDMRTLIRNERRIELCFEGFRFWDLRRWNADLTEKAKGVNINGSAMQYVDVEERLYNNDYMHYGPLPDKEVIKYDALIQNKGW
jgi:hypothetical protein